MRHYKTLLTRSLVIALLALGVLIAAAPAYAHNGEHEGGHETAQLTTEQESESTDPDEGTGGSISGEEREQRIQERQQAREERREVAREKLDAAKKKVCEARQNRINTTMQNVVNRSDRHLDYITKVAVRTQSFYPKSGVTLANYDELVATINEKKAAAEAAIVTVQSKASFSCDSEGPKADIQDFRNHRLGKVEAMREYRTAVRALIDAIKAELEPAAGEEDTTNE